MLREALASTPRPRRADSPSAALARAISASRFLQQAVPVGLNLALVELGRLPRVDSLEESDRRDAQRRTAALQMQAVKASEAGADPEHVHRRGHEPCGRRPAYFQALLLAASAGRNAVTRRFLNYGAFLSGASAAEAAMNSASWTCLS